MKYAQQLISDRQVINKCFTQLSGNAQIADAENGFASANDVISARILINNTISTSFSGIDSTNDCKVELYNNSSVRMVNVVGAMAYTLPLPENFSVNYEVAGCAKITLGDSILTVSAESSNPYFDRPNTWEIYRDEWLLRWINNDQYITQNNLERLSPVVYADTTIKEGYEVYLYNVKINDSKNIERPFYSVGVIRDKNDSVNFGLFVLKSKTQQFEMLKKIVVSYAKIQRIGQEQNYYSAGEPVQNPKWNEDTKNYFNQLMNTQDVKWGVFSYSMPGTTGSLLPGQENYEQSLAKGIAMQQGIEKAWNYNFDIYPTYTHFGYGGNAHYFPLAMANKLAGGNGFNGKPVLQFTFQFTTDNNIVDSNNTPMFDILRGKYDEYFTKLARDIKAYKMPVLFRLNNEMNTDWTSYCGMITLLDPDIFVDTWKYLFNIFERENVDNTMWIWNPIEAACPYSSWGEHLSYNPGAGYIHFLGVTSYEMNNTDKTESFKTRYKRLYEKNEPAFGKYKAIISEFACGSGGDLSGALDRNRPQQVKWVREMFDCLNADKKEPFAKQLAGAVWFNCDDSSDTHTYNRLRFFDPTKGNNQHETIEAFKNGFKI